MMESEQLVENSENKMVTTFKRIYQIPWTFMRAFYTIMGIVIIVQGLMRSEWFGIMFGTYFASMGLFSFGCASGSCFGGSCDVTK